MEHNLASFQIQLEVALDVDINTAWSGLTSELGNWWKKEYYSSTKTLEMKLEPWVGGRMYEDYGGGEGLLWSNVLVMEGPHTLEFKGHLSPDFGGPAYSFLKLSLSQHEGKTTLRLQDTVMGAVTENTKVQLEAGWQDIYGVTFKQYIENK